jgi:hypothetical protein
MSEYLEFQRYGRNKSTLVDKNYISGGEYRKKFDKITDNGDLSRLLYAKAKEMLLHRSGTMYEDMYWIDAEKVDVIAREINSFEEEQILYSETIKEAIEGNDNVIAMHTHPCSMPPSIADFNSVEEHNYQLGIVLCHDGKIFCFRSSEKITKIMYELYVADYYKELHDEYMAQLEALKELSETYDIEFWEVI